MWSGGRTAKCPPSTLKCCKHTQTPLPPVGRWHRVFAPTKTPTALGLKWRLIRTMYAGARKVRLEQRRLLPVWGTTDKTLEFGCEEDDVERRSEPTKEESQLIQSETGCVTHKRPAGVGNANARR